MDKFSKEKLRKQDMVHEKGAEPLWRLNFKKNDEFEPLSIEEIETIERLKKAGHRCKSQSESKKKNHKPVYPCVRENDFLCFESLSSTAKMLFSKVFFFHPDTTIDILKTKDDGSFDFEIFSYNRSFLKNLFRSLIAFDQRILNVISRKSNRSKLGL